MEKIGGRKALEKERLDAMNKPPDIKRSCWVKYKKEAFISGEIQSDELILS